MVINAAERYIEPAIITPDTGDRAKMRMTRIRAAIAVLLTTGALGLATASSASAAQGDLAVGTFTHNVLGYSVFEQPDNASIRTVGQYLFLRPGQSYFTVIYANGNCDPAQAFPVGPFVADKYGRGRINVLTPSTVPVGGTGSISVRRGDNASDIDGDGKTGPSDVVAVPGKPYIGLIECDRHPVIAPATVNVVPPAMP